MCILVEYKLYVQLILYLHDDTFARGNKTAQKKNCTKTLLYEGSLLHEDTFPRKHFCTDRIFYLFLFFNIFINFILFFYFNFFISFI